ncbi:hypothetical protein ACWF62_17795 [Rhodococcus sp. NPDC054953]
MTQRIGNTEFRTEDGRTTATGPNGTIELANGETYTDPDTGAKVTPRGDSVHITGNINGGFTMDFS